MPGKLLSAFVLLIGLTTCLGCAPAFDDHADELPPAIACDPSQTDEGEGLAGEASFDADEVPCIGVTLSPAHYDALRRQSRGGGKTELDIAGNILAAMVRGCGASFPNRYTWFEADVEIDGVVVSQVGVRKKGFVGSVIGTGLAKPSLKLKSDRFVDDQTFAGTERITLNNGSEDATRMSSCLAYDVFHDAGYPAPRCNFANVMVNDRATGSYAHVEAIDKPFLRRAFGNDTGSLYEGTRADFTDDFVGGFSSGQLGRFEAKTRDTDPTGAPLRRLADALKAPDEDLLDSLEPVLDLERFFFFWALEFLVAHSDGYTWNRNNFYVYFDPAAGGRAVFIPWGTDQCFSESDGFSDADTRSQPFVRGEIARRLSRIPAARDRFHETMRQLLDYIWDEARMVARVDAYGLQIQSAETPARYEETLAILRAWIQTRRHDLEAVELLQEGRSQPADCQDNLFPVEILDLLQRVGFAG